MVKRVNIENYKSVQSLSLELGRFNVLVGENGSGKTNILEALILGSAASEDKMDHEFLGSRGLRNTDLIKSGFSSTSISSSIKVRFDRISNKSIVFSIDYQPQSKYLEVTTVEVNDLGIKLNPAKSSLEALIIEELKKEGFDITEKNGLVSFDFPKDGLHDFFEKLNTNPFLLKFYKSFISQSITDAKKTHGIGHFLLFAPENYFLRRFEEDSQIYPLGIRGEGLFSHLVDLSREKPALFQEIQEHLKLIDWYGGFEIPSDLMFSERRIRIRDRYLDEGLAYIDQRSSNEGFLYLLFYLTLFVSDATPKFFAIDNLDNSLNPGLCSKLVETLAQLAKKHDKQVIVTTHNPAVLDGLNLHDDEQRLFVVSRNANGHTKARRIEEKPSTNGNGAVKLSEQFLRGYLGGLPTI